MTKETKTKMEAAVSHLRDELKQIRTGRANPAMLFGVTVEVYGAQMRLQDVANISAPEAQQLVVSPFDTSNLQNISAAIEKANLNLRPVIETSLIRITIPPMDEAQRKDKAKEAKKKGEEAKVSIRNVRRDSNDFVRKEKNDGNIAEDELKRAEKEIQNLTDKFCLEVDTIITEKEKDIMTL